MIDKNGREVVDSRPVEIPLKFKRSLTLEERIANVIRAQSVQRDLARVNMSFEEEDNFDTGEADLRPEFNSPYEENFDKSEQLTNDLKTIAAAKKEAAENRRKKAAAAAQAAAQAPAPASPEEE